MAAALMLAWPDPGVAQPRPQAIDEQIPPSPLELLLEQRTQLSLSSEQLGRIDQLQRRLTNQNEPLVSRMMALRNEWQQERRGGARDNRAQNPRIRRIRALAENLRARIQRNNRAAMQSVNRILTPPQRAQLRGLLQDRREQNRGRRGGGDAVAGDGR